MICWFAHIISILHYIGLRGVVINIKTRNIFKTNCATLIFLFLQRSTFIGIKSKLNKTVKLKKNKTVELRQL